MKKYLAMTALALLMPVAAFAQSLDRFDVSNEIIRAENNDGGYYCGSTNAVSVTVPAGASYVRIDPTISHYGCFENIAQVVCGTGRPTSGTGTTAWSHNPSGRHLMEVTNNSASLKPNRMWLQLDNASDCVFWHWNAGQPNE